MSHHAVSKHHPHLKYLDHKELDALYWSVFIKGIGDSFISIFTAIYLLSIGLSLRSVAVYYILFFAVSTVTARYALQLGHNWGVKKTLTLGTAGLILTYALLPLVKEGLPYQYVGIVSGLGACLYWTAFQLDLARALRSRSSGRTLSNIKIFSILASIVGPVAGALFIVNTSFAVLILVVAAIFALSVIPLLRRGDYKVTSPLPTVRASLTIGGRRKAAMYMLFGVTESAVDILWPVFIYLHYANILSIGGIVSITSLLMLCIIYVLGKMADRNSAQAYRIGVLTHAPTWILRLLWVTPGGLLVGNVLGSATSSLIAITVDQTMYRDAKDAETSSASILFRSYYAAVGRIGILLFAILINSTSILFVVIAALVLLQILTSPVRHRAVAT